MNPDWGDMPTWFAVAFAAIAAKFAGDQLRALREQVREQGAFIVKQSGVLDLQAEQLRHEQEERRTAQQRQVNVSTVLHERPPNTDGTPGRNEWEVIVMNRSQDSIHDVNVSFGTYEAHEVIVGNYMADTSRQQPPVHVLGPMRTATFLRGWLPAATLANNPPIVTFHDSGGHVWKEDRHGARSEVPPTPQP